MDPTEAVDKLRLTLRSFTAFKSYYFEYRTLSSTETPDNPWKFQCATKGVVETLFEKKK